MRNLRFRQRRWISFVHQHGDESPWEVTVKNWALPARAALHAPQAPDHIPRGCAVHQWRVRVREFSTYLANLDNLANFNNLTNFDNLPNFDSLANLAINLQAVDWQLLATLWMVTLPLLWPPMLTHHAWLLSFFLIPFFSVFNALHLCPWWKLATLQAYLITETRLYRQFHLPNGSSPFIPLNLSRLHHLW